MNVKLQKNMCLIVIINNFPEYSNRKMINNMSRL